MTRMRIALSAALSGLGAALLMFSSPPGIARADIAGPSLIWPDFSAWNPTAVAIVCVVAVIVVMVGVGFILRARDKKKQARFQNDHRQPPPH